MSSTAIDNVITNVVDSEVSVLNTAISDHYAQEIVIRRCSLHREPPTALLKRDVQPNNIRLLNRSLQKENWSFLTNSTSVDDMFNSFFNCFLFHLNVSCPFRKGKRRIKQLCSNWITPGILVSRERLKFYSEIMKHTNDNRFKEHFRNYKRIYKRTIKFAKSYEINKQIKNSKNLSKTVWNIINDTKNKTSTKVSRLCVEGRLITESREIAREFNKFFSSVAGPQVTGTTRANVGSGPSPVSSLVLYPVCEAEVARVVENLSSKKSVDISGMSMWLLKQCYHHIVGPLTTIINFSFEAGFFPKALKNAKVIPILKKNDPSEATNYRPISILPIFSKVFEKLFLNRLLSFLEKHEIISNNQFGFRTGKSTVDAVTQLVDFVVEGLEERKQTLSVFLDLSKAFDCVNHKILLHTVEGYGIRGVAFEWLSSYLRDRMQCVQVQNVLSETIQISQGVPQGSILGPVLFILYVNNLNSRLLDSRIIQYADDTTLCVRDASLKSLEIQTFVGLNSCIQNFLDKNLNTNCLKTNYIQYCLRKQNHRDNVTVVVDDVVIDETDTTKFLGMHLDKGLTWKSHVDSVCSKIASGIFVLRQLSLYCTTEVQIMAYYGLIFPHLSYGITLWGSSANVNIERVFKLQKKAVRIIAKLNYRESCRDAFRDLGFLTLPCLYILETTWFCKFKCNHTLGRDVHGYETRERAVLRIAQHRTAAFERLPSQAGVKFVNSLPAHLRTETNPKLFKARLKYYLVSNVYYSVDEFMA